jgi:SPP1 gp7 family putative phage head morphogenesis protein
MEYIEQEKWSRQKVLGAYGLNRIGAGDYEDINFATIREGRKMLWYDTYIPMDEVLLDAINGQWINYVDQGKYELYSDYTKVPALQADLQERAKTGGILVREMGYPPSLASRMVELPLKAEDIEKWPHLDEKQVSKEPAFSPANGDESTKALISKSTKRRDYSDEYIERVLDPGEKFFKRSLDRYFVDQRNSIMDVVDVWSRKQEKAIKNTQSVSAWEFLPVLIRENLELLKIYRPAVKNQITVEKKQVEADLGRGIQWDAGDMRMQYWVNKRSIYLEDINTSTFEYARDAIDATIRQGTADGLIPSEMAREIKKAVHTVYEVRLGRPVEANGLFDLGGMSSSQTIARTEMGSIASLARADMFKSEGIERIEWSTSQDDKVRDSHAALDGVQVAFGEEFPDIGMRYPRDERGEAGEVINCRCAFVAVIPGDEV